jgi:hypothetical protein
MEVADKKRNNLKLSSLLLRSSTPNTSSINTTNTIIINEQILKAEKDFERYLHEKRRLYLVKLVEALTIGAEAHISDEKAKIDQSFRIDFVPSLLRFVAMRIISHAMKLFQNENFGSKKDEIRFESQSLTESIDQQIVSLLKSYETNLQKALSDHHLSIQMRTLDQLSVTVLEREKYWKEKTMVDVQNYHNLKLYEFIVARSLQTDNGEVSRTRVSVEEDNVSRNGHLIKLRELNSENILKRFTFSVHDHSSSILDEPTTRAAPTRPEPHSIEEYYQQADRSPSFPLSFSSHHYLLQSPSQADREIHNPSS